jgi:predicted helicase
LATKKVPAKVQKYLSVPNADEGIDLIAETKEGKFWAIQCKYKSDESKSVTLKELSTFTSLAFAKCKNTELGLVCTNVDRLSSKLKGYEGKLQFCAGYFWQSLDKDFF